PRFLSLSRYLVHRGSSFSRVCFVSSASLRLSFFFFFQCYGHHRDLHSFPTRRSSDLSLARLPGVIDESKRLAGIRDNVIRPSERSEEHTSELQSRFDLVCRLLLEKKKTNCHSRPPLDVTTDRNISRTRTRAHTSRAER